MKVLHVINSLTSGGAENMLIGFFSELKKDNFEILLLVDDNIAFNIPKHIKYTTLSNSNKRYSFKKLFQLYKFIKKGEFDIVHSHLFPSQYYVGIISFFFTEIKFITTEHNTTNTRRNNWFFRITDTLIYKQYDKIIFISQGVKNSFFKNFKNIKTKGIIINNGISLKKFQVKKNNTSIKTKIIMVARFSEQKDHITLIKTMLLLDKKYTLTLVGEGPLLKDVKLFVKKNNLDKRVSFLGFRKDIEKLYQEYHLFVLSSIWEGFGLVVIEAMASGLPVIASNVDGLRDVVQDAGLLFEPSNEKELASLISKVLTNRGLYANLKKRGLKRAGLYDIKTLVKKTVALYNEYI
jgi:glycosyltransferase involved in cell wall biosynthesis